MLIKHKVACIRLVNEEILEVSLITDLSVNKDKVVNAYQRFKSEINHEIFQLEDMLSGKNIELKTLFGIKIFEDVTKLNDEEIELLTKVIYNEEIYDKKCPVCLNEHPDGEVLVSLSCPCKRERLCHSCAVMAMKKKSQCPCCRSYV